MNWRWLLWLAYAASWTIALVAPVPDAENLPFGEELFDFRMVFAKTVHVSAYAVFAVLTGWLRVPLRCRLPLLFFLMLHGAGTEWMQEKLTSTRSGSLNDVLLDHLGIAIGCCLSWKWWTREEN